MARLARRLIILAGLGLAAGPLSAEPSIAVVGSEDPKLVIGEVAFEGGKTLALTHGIGSGAFRRNDAPDGIFVAVSDRGANFTCGDAEGVIGIAGQQFCGEVKGGRIYPVPGYSPSIYRIRVGESGFEMLDIVVLKDQDGVPITGLPNTLTVATTETPLDATGQTLERDPAAIDAEGIVELADRTFWIGEENAPSILKVAADGRILRRVVPAGTEGDFAGAGYDVAGGLPAILARRQANRGIESVALSPDGTSLFFVLQNPLANPDAKAYGQARNTRLFRYDLEQQAVVDEYVYELTEMASFPGEESKQPSTARISELLALDDRRLLILDRTDRTTLIFEIDLAGATDILGSAWDDPATSPSLEQVSLAEAGIVPATKRLVLDSSGHPELPGKIEGMAFFADGDLMLVNDNDFAIEGAVTKVARVKGLDLAR